MTHPHKEQIRTVTPKAQQEPVVEKKADTKPRTLRERRKAKREGIKVAKSTAFLRRRKVAEQEQQKAEGIYVQREQNPELRVFEDPPVMSLSQLMEEISDEEAAAGLTALEMHNFERSQSPEGDENLTLEFWANQGLSQNSFSNSLGYTRRSTVDSVSL
jgi:hypothetical protein